MSLLAINYLILRNDLFSLIIIYFGYFSIVQ